jgi:hypothetical protein
MAAVIKIPAKSFEAKLRLEDYQVLRSFHRGKHAISIWDMREEYDHLYELDAGFVQEMCISLPLFYSDQAVLEYCINKAQISHPYEEYV